ncbi:DUF6173 family protein [Aestuariivita sp.]|jgi:hypothetical protein|uniref:DUF6173 family protein n=1 Tax=Aestuariivita sp. TaxID=1872407 RepID=UPI002171122A|nr:DUF6173 family protein [Aestuariivita sp.]MCE8009210.1 hypothetical protein [Aestuariivita sp.]|eukprot:TRINITY_DN26773_c0_g1_i2.p2 TRINITY_DN26773_c0_g1~~TRINITY_DN26773_c0_g1_i2.p2  ORF type:complete len:156 (-),score=7.45 TRINITY_DN26773_c0_g1_i2:406-873(-)
MDNKIRTTAELNEADALPRVHEVHAGAEDRACMPQPPEDMKKAVERKSAARWAYERIILYIQNFEKQLDGEHEVAMGFAGGEIGVLRIEGMGYFDPDIVTFYGSDQGSGRTQLIQHVSQLNVMLRALPKPEGQREPQRIGFRLAADLSETATAPD